MLAGGRDWLVPARDGELHTVLARDDVVYFRARLGINDSKWARSSGRFAHTRASVLPTSGAYCRDCTELRNFLRPTRRGEIHRAGNRRTLPLYIAGKGREGVLSFSIRPYYRSPAQSRCSCSLSFSRARFIFQSSREIASLFTSLCLFLFSRGR